MRKLIVLLVFTSNLIFSQNEKKQLRFNINSDTIHFNSVSSPSFILKDGHKFFMLSKQDIQPYSTQSAKFLMIFNSNKLEFEAPIPDKLNTIYIDIFKKNDSILYKKYLDNNTFYLNKNFEWKETYKSDDLIYQDNNFYVTSLDFGEFGKRTWFKDKRHKNEYYFDLFTSTINKIKHNYYITTSKKIYFLPTPQKLKKATKNDLYENFKNSHQNPSGYQTSKILKTYFSSDKKEFYIITSFVSMGNLYHIFRESGSTYIGVIRDNKMTIVQDLPNDIIPFQNYFNYRNKIQNNKQIIQFKTTNKNLTGIIEIDNNNIFIFYFKNEFKEGNLGYPNAKTEFEKKVDFLFKNIGKINLNQISDYEKKSTPITHFMKLEYKGKKNQDFKGPMIYKTTEDNYFEIHTLYSYDVQNIIEGITFNWNRNLDYERQTNFINYDDRKKGEDQRYVNIKNFIISKFGNPTLESENDSNKKNTWKINDKTIQLNQGEYYLEMKIFIN